MNATDRRRAVGAAMAVASTVGLRVDDATVINDSNRIAVRLLPGDVLARVAYQVHRAGAAFEVEVARRLAEVGSPVAALDPRAEHRVYLRGGFAVTLWTYYEPVPSRLDAPDYAQALLRLHAGMSQVEIKAPHFTDRVESARSSLADRARTPDVGDADRELLIHTLDRLTASITNRGCEEQLLHGEPHPGNLLNTQAGPLFIDLETCCRGPVEFDLAHASEEVSDHYPGAGEELLTDCRILMLAMITAWRWDRDDDLPNGRQLASDWLSQMRTALDRSEIDVR